MDGNADTTSDGKLGDKSGDLVAALYDDLHRAARRERFRAGKPDTLQTTAVLNEAYLKLSTQPEWESRDHFMAVASTTMRHVLVDAARARLATKRGGGNRPLPLEAADDVERNDEVDAELVKLGDALAALAGFDEGLAQLVDCRFFAGMTETETASVLGVSDRTVRRRWLQARAWIHQEMAD